MKHLILLSILSLVFGCKSGQTIPDLTSREDFSVETTRNTLTDLSSDEMEGRKPGSRGMEKAARYIEDYLSSAGIKPFFNSTYRDSFQAEGTETYNIVGLIESKKESNEYILLGAHFDHIGKLTPTSGSVTDSVYNGANDNASGVTAVLEIAKLLSNQELDKNIIVALFSGEESGLLGSRHLAEKLKAEELNLQYVITFEMIGKALTSGKNQVYITGFNRSNLSEAVNQVLDREFITYLAEEEQHQLFSRSDNYPFYEIFRIPAHTISSFDFKNYPYYHHLRDEAGELDPENMNAIIASSALAIKTLINEDKLVELKEASEN